MILVIWLICYCFIGIAVMINILKEIMKIQQTKNLKIIKLYWFCSDASEKETDLMVILMKV